MHIFKDNRGREWSIPMDDTAISRVREMLGINLHKLFARRASLIFSLAKDPATLVNLLYVLCKPQADNRGVSDAEFGASLVGDEISAAVSAFVLRG